MDNIIHRLNLVQGELTTDSAINVNPAVVSVRRGSNNARGIEISLILCLEMRVHM